MKVTDICIVINTVIQVISFCAKVYKNRKQK